MTALRANQALVADEILLDGRLALFHQRERWLAVADLHFGYELSQRAAGRLVPMWGMASISERLLQLVDEYQPARLIILGDLVHDQTAAREAAELLQKIAALCEPIVVAGNHDRRLRGKLKWWIRGKPTTSIFIMVIARRWRRTGSKSSGIIIRRGW